MPVEGTHPRSPICPCAANAAKAEWIRKVNSPELVYVSGRTRPAGEINGKSGNLNNALDLIYPPGVEVPLDEIICVFDADQARFVPWPRGRADFRVHTGSHVTCTSQIRKPCFRTGDLYLHRRVARYIVGLSPPLPAWTCSFGSQAGVEKWDPGTAALFCLVDAESVVHSGRPDGACQLHVKRG